MAFLNLKNVAVRGMAACVPKTVIDNVELAASIGNLPYDVKDFIATTGVKSRHKDKVTKTSDMCCAAAERLLTDLKWERSEVDALILVTQTNDYLLPATACVMQDRLGLSKETYCEDIGFGCSGWVYGLSTLGALMQNGNIRRALLCSGECWTQWRDEDMLFGCAGTATALEYSEEADSMYFHFGTDGSGADAIMIPHGGAAHWFDESSLNLFEYEGQMYNSVQVQMKGMDVFSFGITTAPKSIKKLAAQYGFDHQQADYLVLHQANKKMNDLIIKKILPPPIQGNALRRIA